MVLRFATAIPNANIARRETHSPPPSVNPMAWRVIPSLLVKREGGDLGVGVGAVEGRREGRMEVDGRVEGMVLGDGVVVGLREGMAVTLSFIACCILLMFVRVGWTVLFVMDPGLLVYDVSITIVSFHAHSSIQYVNN